MTNLVNALRSEFQIPSLCQILIGTVFPYWEQGVHRHFIHHTTGPAKLNQDGTLAPDSYGTLAVETQFARRTGMSRFLEDEKGTTPYRAPFETLTVSMPLEGSGAAHRTQILTEVTGQLQELMFFGTPVPMVTVSREVKLGKNTIIRHHLVAILDAYQRPFWVHPAMATFGLGEMPFELRPEATKPGLDGASLDPVLIPNRILGLDHDYRGSLQKAWGEAGACNEGESI